MKSAIVKSIFLFIIFFNQIFAKDFDDLFNITIEVKGETIDKSIDRSFNNLVFRLIGSQDNEKVKSIKAEYRSKDFLKNYAVNSNEAGKFLQASFDEEIVINQFIDNGISFIGRNRPVIFLDIQIDNGFDKPFKIESIPYETKLESSIQRIFYDISEKRGLFFEFPQNTINIDNDGYFFEDKNNNKFEQYKFDYFTSFLISRSGINRWSLSYKDQVSFFDDSNEIIESIYSLFNNLSTEYLSNFILETTEKEISMRVSKVSSAEQFDNLLDALDKMISIKAYSVKSFEKNEISFTLTIFGTEEQFIKSVQTHKDFLLKTSSADLIEVSLNSI